LAALDFIGILVASIAILLTVIALRDTFGREQKHSGRFGQLIRTKSLRASLRESVEFETRILERVLDILPKLYEEGIKPRGEGPAGEGEIAWLDANIPGPLRKQYEDLDFLLDLHEFLGGKHSARDELTFCKAYYYAGILAFKYRDLTKAIGRFQRLVAFDERLLERIGLSMAKGLSYLGTSYLFLADERDKELNLTQGIVHLRASYLLSSTPITGYNLAWGLDELGNFDEAITVLREVVTSSPKLGKAKYNLACTLAKTGKLEEALHELEQIPSDDPVWKEAQADSDLSPLRESEWKERFEKLLAKEEART
jgi:tetratricopeptide (TPR) repeat protein